MKVLYGVKKLNSPELYQILDFANAEQERSRCKCDISEKISCIRLRNFMIMFN